MYNAVFSPNGARVLAASWDKTARLWCNFATTQQLIDDACSILPNHLPACSVGIFSRRQPQRRPADELLAAGLGRGDRYHERIPLEVLPKDRENGRLADGAVIGALVEDRPDWTSDRRPASRLKSSLEELVNANARARNRLRNHLQASSCLTKRALEPANDCTDIVATKQPKSTALAGEVDRVPRAIPWSLLPSFSREPCALPASPSPLAVVGLMPGL